MWYSIPLCHNLLALVLHVVQLKMSLLLYTVCKPLVTPGQEQTTLAKTSQSTTEAKRKRYPMSEEKVAGFLLRSESDCKHIVVFKVSLILPLSIQEYDPARD